MDDLGKLMFYRGHASQKRKFQKCATFATHPFQ